MRVVKMRIFSPVSASVKSTSAPSERPIQLRCMASTRSGQPPSSCFMASSKFGSIGGGFEEPLLHGALFHRGGFMTPATAIHHLFVGEHGAALGAPVEQRFFAIGEAALIHLQKEPLVPAIVFGFAGGDFAAPIESETEARELHLHVGDVGKSPLARLAIVLDGGVFRGQTKGVPAHGMQHVVAAHPHVAGERVANGVVAHVSHVQLAAGIRQHFEHVILRPFRRVGYVERRVLGPAFVPAWARFLWGRRLFRGY